MISALFLLPCGEKVPKADEGATADVCCTSNGGSLRSLPLTLTLSPSGERGSVLEPAQ